LKEKLFKDFHEFYPGKFNNKTNGISQRQWLLKSNPLLAQYINSLIGEKWITDLSKLKKLLPFEDNKDIHEQWRKIKMENKKYLAGCIKRQMDIAVDPDSLFDVQVKRIHEYKRQLLFGFYIISEYLRIINDPKSFIQPRTFIIAGKAAPAYTLAKLIIKFINSIADKVNADPKARDLMKVIFLEDYRVSLAELIFPASDLSEQISTAGMEASGTGNMKFMLNGALTVGTLDGANIEIAQNVGRDNIFIFGLQAHEVDALRKSGYNPMDYVGRSPALSQIHELIKGNFFAPNEPGVFEPLLKTVFHNDFFLVCADFDAYRKTQDDVSLNYKNDRTYWTKKSIVNVANAGTFSSDRTIQQYAQEIWDVPFTVS
jgi:starch phosphorylase